ncbi:hypothetical protein MMC29_005307 [Sticta canariensis]|nr:hypothetical protein [Sticta canariensis]
MPIFAVSAEALEQIIIGMHFGGFDSVDMAHHISHKYPDLSHMPPEDIGVLFEHQKRIRSLVWTQCTENTGQSPTVLRVLMDIQGLPGNTKHKKGQYNNNNNAAGGATKPRNSKTDHRKGRAGRWGNCASGARF